MNIGKMILAKDRKLLNQCNSLGGTFCVCITIYNRRDAYFVVRESRSSYRQRKHHHLSNRRLSRPGALPRHPRPRHSQAVRSTE